MVECCGFSRTRREARGTQNLAGVSCSRLWEKVGPITRRGAGVHRILPSVVHPLPLKALFTYPAEGARPKLKYRREVGTPGSSFTTRLKAVLQTLINYPPEGGTPNFGRQLVGNGR